MKKLHVLHGDGSNGASFQRQWERGTAALGAQALHLMVVNNPYEEQNGQICPKCVKIIPKGNKMAGWRARGTARAVRVS